MILELAQHVQAFLHAHNVPGYNSFYEEMMSNKKKEKEKEAKEREKRQELQRKREEKLVNLYRFIVKGSYIIYGILIFKAFINNDFFSTWMFQKLYRV